MNRISNITYNLLYQPLKSIFTEYRRITFMTLLVIIEVFSICFTAVSAFLIYLFYDPNSLTTVAGTTSNSENASSQRNGGVKYIGLTVVGLFLMAICIVGLRGADLVNLNLLLTFFWGVMVFIGPLLLACVIGFDFYTYIPVYFKHSWTTTSFHSIRRLTCNPEATADTLCNVPYPFPYAFPKPQYSDVNAWCVGEWGNITHIPTTAVTLSPNIVTMNNSGVCNRIYTDAITQAQNNATTGILVISIICVVTSAFIVAAQYLCYYIITGPILSESMNDIINYLLVFPMVTCLVMAWYMWDWQFYTGLPYAWSPIAFISFGAALGFALPLGVVGGRMKSRNMLSLYILVLFLVSVGLCVLGAFGVVYSSTLRLAYIIQVPTSTLQVAACQKQLAGCCCCQGNVTYNGLTCPEWTNEEILSYLGLDLKIAGVVSFISLLYVLGGLSVAFLVRKSLKNYKTDYV